MCTEMVKAGDTGRALSASTQGPPSRDLKNEEELAGDGERDVCSRQREEQVQSPDVRARVACSRDLWLFTWLELGSQLRLSSHARPGKPRLGVITLC